MRKLIIILSICLLITPCYAGSISRYKTYSVGDQVTADNLNGNLDNAYNELNGSLDNDNADSANARFVDILGSEPASTIEGRIIYSKADDNIFWDTGSILIGAVGDSADNTITGANTFTGLNTFSNIDINGGSFDGTPVGLTTPSSGTFTTVQFNTSFTDNQGTVVITGILDEDSMSTDSAVHLVTQQSIKAYADAIKNTSNVLFVWSGVSTFAAGNSGAELGTTQYTAENNADPDGYFYLINDQTGYVTFLNFKFVKLPNISTITIYANMSVVNTYTATCNVDIGGQSGDVTETSATAVWGTPDTIDVSGLTNGTAYDGIVQLKTSAIHEPAQLWAITLIGS